MNWSDCGFLRRYLNWYLRRCVVFWLLYWVLNHHPPSPFFFTLSLSLCEPLAVRVRVTYGRVTGLNDWAVGFWGGTWDGIRDAHFLTVIVGASFSSAIVDTRFLNVPPTHPLRGPCGPPWRTGLGLLCVELQGGFWGGPWEGVRDAHFLAFIVGASFSSAIVGTRFLNTIVNAPFLNIPPTHPLRGPSGPPDEQGWGYFV